MVAVIPFIGKIMEACKDSMVYRPSNPWISSILSLLAEVHSLEKLKLNITFEIELICQIFALKVADLKPASELKSRKVHLSSLSPHHTHTDSHMHYRTLAR